MLGWHLIDLLGLWINLCYLVVCLDDCDRLIDFCLLGWLTALCVPIQSCIDFRLALACLHTCLVIWFGCFVSCFVRCLVVMFVVFLTFTCTMPCTCTMYLRHPLAPCTCTIHLHPSTCTHPLAPCTCTMHLHHVLAPSTCTVHLLPMPMPMAMSMPMPMPFTCTMHLHHSLHRSSCRSTRGRYYYRSNNKWWRCDHK